MPAINNPVQIGAILTGRRKHLKLSQADVANRLGLSQNRISELEAKPGTLTIEQLLALLNVLGLEMVVDAPTTRKPKVEW